jgi:hypothetical protein
MKVTVVFEDNKILVDGEVKSGFDFTDIDKNWRVVQWNETHGWIEVHYGERIWLDNFSLVEPYLDMFVQKLI